MSFGTVLLSLVFTTLGAGDGHDAEQDLVFLGEDRPVFVRLRITVGDQPFRTAWPDSIRAIHASLDRDGDGKLTVKEADKTALTTIVRLATGVTANVNPNVNANAVAGANTLFKGELDVRPKDGIVSLDELTDALRPHLGPFRLQASRTSGGRTDALFEYLDRDKDGQLTRSEMAALVGSLRRLDLDDNEMVIPEELEPFNSPSTIASDQVAERRARITALPPVIELAAGESTLRAGRMLIKKYDKGRGDSPGPPDGKLSDTEFAIDPGAFSAADSGGDGTLNIDDVRRFLSHVPIDLTIDVAFPSDPTGRTTTTATAAKPSEAKVRPLGDGDFEFSIGTVRLDVHVDDGKSALADARQIVTSRFNAFDANKDGYLEAKEFARDNDINSPFAGLFDVIDRDGDGKLYPKEFLDFVDRQSTSAQNRLSLNALDQGRAIFGILDLNRDRRLGAREMLRTVDRISSWDSDGDGRVTAEEIPYHFQVTLARGLLPGLTGFGVGIVNNTAVVQAMNAPRASSLIGPDWFRKMDRNKDGDISRREFFGPRDDFDRLDRDKDGLLSPDEADAAKPKAR